jgi:hypothetical protein
MVFQSVFNYRSYADIFLVIGSQRDEVLWFQEKKWQPTRKKLRWLGTMSNSAWCTTIWLGYNQDYFTDNISHNFMDEKRLFYHGYWRGSFSVHMAISNRRRLTAESSGAKLECFLNPFDSLYLSACNLWLFWRFEYKIRKQSFQTIEDRDRDLGRLEIRKIPVCLLQSDSTFWKGHWAWGRLLYSLTLNDHLSLFHRVTQLARSRLVATSLQTIY